MSTAPANKQASDSVDQLLATIQEELMLHDDAAKSLQQSRWRLGFSLILLGPLALLFLAVQPVLKVQGKQALILTAFEVSLLLLALIASFWQVGTSHEEWIRERLRTEILRRECFLLQARVGPYLEPGGLSFRVKNRLQSIGNSAKDPVELVPMVAEQGDETWREQLEAVRGQSLPMLPHLSSAIRQYLGHRVEDQRKWFVKRGGEHLSWALGLERTAKIILVFAVVVAIVHFMRSLDNIDKQYEDPGWLFFIGISLPAIGAAVVGFQSLLENERLARSYAYHSQRLENFALRLRTLQSKLEGAESKEPELQFQFMRIVLAVEEMFSEELLQWRLVMEPRTPRAEV